jgi:hypothetical protein
MERHLFCGLGLWGRSAQTNPEFSAVIPVKHTFRLFETAEEEVIKTGRYPSHA